MANDSNPFIDRIDYLWKLSDRFTAKDAIALIADIDPSAVLWQCDDSGEVYAFKIDKDYAFVHDIENMDARLWAAYRAITNAITGGTLKAISLGKGGRPLVKVLSNAVEGPRTQGPVTRKEYLPTDWFETTIAVNDLSSWLDKRGVKVPFFQEPGLSDAEYLRQNHPRFANKLAAAIHAWQAVIDPGSTTPKQALMKWLRMNAAKYDLCDAEGKPNETAIDEIAKIANWKPSGGAPSTPTHEKPTPQ